MPSRALVRWESAQQVELDRLDAAHFAVGGAGPGRRTATQHINDAYIVLLAAHFQQFCRDLHTEAAKALAASTPHVTDVVMSALMRGRQLDRGNARPSALTADYQRLGIEIWPELALFDRRTAVRRRRLEQLNVWRNAVAHGDFQLSPGAVAAVAGTRRTLAFVQACRACCEVLARQFDAVVEDHLSSLLGAPPW